MTMRSSSHSTALPTLHGVAFSNLTRPQRMTRERHTSSTKSPDDPYNSTCLLCSLCVFMHITRRGATFNRNYGSLMGATARPPLKTGRQLVNTYMLQCAQRYTQCTVQRSRGCALVLCVSSCRQCATRRLKVKQASFCRTVLYQYHKYSVG